MLRLIFGEERTSRRGCILDFNRLLARHSGKDLMQRQFSATFFSTQSTITSTPQLPNYSTWRVRQHTLSSVRPKKSPSSKKIIHLQKSPRATNSSTAPTTTTTWTNGLNRNSMNGRSRPKIRYLSRRGHGRRQRMTCRITFKVSRTSRR